MPYTHSTKVQAVRAGADGTVVTGSADGNCVMSPSLKPIVLYFCEGTICIWKFVDGRFAYQTTLQGHVRGITSLQIVEQMYGSIIRPMGSVVAVVTKWFVSGCFLLQRTTQSKRGI